MKKINNRYLQYVVVSSLIGVLVTAMFFSDRFSGVDKLSTDPKVIEKLFWTFYSAPILLSVAIFGWDTPGSWPLLALMFIAASLLWGGVIWLILFGAGHVRRLFKQTA